MNVAQGSHRNDSATPRSIPPPCCPPSFDPLTSEQVAHWVGRAETLAGMLPGLSWRTLLYREGLTGARADQVIDVLEGRA